MSTEERDSTDTRQAELLLGNATNFLSSARRSGFTDAAAYQMTIALELLLKSRLSLAGVPDRVCQGLGHDLRLCTALARGLGIQITPEIEKLVSVLCPYYRTGGFHRFPGRRWSYALLRGASSALTKLTASTMATVFRDRRGYRAVVDALPWLQREVFLRATDDEAIASIARNLGMASEVTEALLADALVRIDLAKC